MATRLGDAALLTPCTITENGEDCTYLVFHHGTYTQGDFSPPAVHIEPTDYFSMYSGLENVTLLIREKTPFSQRITGSNDNCDGDLISVYLDPLFESLSLEIQSLSRQVTVPIFCYRYTGSSNYYIQEATSHINLPSPQELTLAFPQSEERIAYSDTGQTPTKYWTRDIYYAGDKQASAVDETGEISKLSFRLSAGYRPFLALDSNLAWITEDGRIVANTPPAITGTDGDLGTFGETSPTYAYTVTDQQGGTVSVTEALDGETLRTYTVTLGQQNTLTIPSATYLTTLNGTHTLTITATDSVGASTTRTETFTKDVTSCAFTLTDAFPADDMPTRCVINIQGAFPEGSTLTVQICNNGNDASPTWETITQQALLGQKYFFQNETKTASSWGVKVQASLARGTAEGDCYISSIGGVFQ